MPTPDELGRTVYGNDWPTVAAAAHARIAEHAHAEQRQARRERRTHALGTAAGLLAGGLVFAILTGLAIAAWKAAL